jgi:1-acyl-sn-glycerol-3-phosphate acyltransferase
MLKLDLASTTAIETTSTDLSVSSQLADSNSQFSPWLISCAYFFGRRLVLPLYFSQIKIVGRENIPQTGPVILAPTHRSRWDSIMLAYAVGRPVSGRDIRFMVTSSECLGVQGWFIRRMGGFPVNVHRPAIATLRHAIELMQQGEILVIYPEGGIYRDGKVHPLKSGIARLALLAESSQANLGIKILPIAINYNQPLPHWGANVRIDIGEPIKVVNYNSGNLKRDAKTLTADLTIYLRKTNIQ